MTSAPNLVIHSGGGHRFHTSTWCPAFLAGRNIWDTDQWVPGWPRPRRIREETRHDAVCRGLDPCRVCLPDEPRPFRSSPSFGHEPVMSFVDGRGLGLICARCERIRRGPGLWWHVPVRWPCTSALVLGLPYAREHVR